MRFDHQCPLSASKPTATAKSEALSKQHQQHFATNHSNTRAAAVQGTFAALSWLTAPGVYSEAPVATEMHSPAQRALSHLVMVAGHSVYTGASCKFSEARDNKNWFLVPYQRIPGTAESFVQHIQAGVEVCALASVHRTPLCTALLYARHTGPARAQLWSHPGCATTTRLDHKASNLHCQGIKPVFRQI